MVINTTIISEDDTFIVYKIVVIDDVNGSFTTYNKFNKLTNISFRIEEPIS